MLYKYKRLGDEINSIVNLANIVVSIIRNLAVEHKNHIKIIVSDDSYPITDIGKYICILN